MDSDEEDYSFAHTPAYKMMLRLPKMSPMRNQAPYRDKDTKAQR